MKSPEAEIMQYLPTIRSGGFADIGPRRYMEDQHIKIDDLSMYLGSDVIFPKPNAFYGVGCLSVCINNSTSSSLSEQTYTSNYGTGL